MEKIFGYVRVSTDKQVLDRQINSLISWGVPKENIITDKTSGKTSYDSRAGYHYLKTLLRNGDTLVVHELTRLGRNYKEIKEEFERLCNENIAVVVLDIPLLDTRKKSDDDLLSTLVSSLALNIFSYVAELELQTLNKRRMEGIAAAKAKGIHCGRKPMPIPDGFFEECRKWKSGKQTAVATRKKLGLAHTTFYTMAKKYHSRI